MKKTLLIALTLAHTTSLYAATGNFKCYVMSRYDDIRNIKTTKVTYNGFYKYAVNGKKANVTYTSGAQKSFSADYKEINLNDYKGLSSLNLRGSNTVKAFIIDEFSKGNPTVIVDKVFKREEHDAANGGFKKYDIYFGEVYMKSVYNKGAPSVATLGCIKE